MRVRRLLASLVVVAAAASVLAGCAPEHRFGGDASCPPHLASAVEDRARFAGALTVRVDVVDPAALGLPSAQTMLTRSCVVRVRSITPDVSPTSFQALIPGGDGVARALGLALLRDGWRASRPDSTGGTVEFVRSGGARATIDAYSADLLLWSLPPGVELAKDSAYRSGPVVVLGLSVPAGSGAATSASPHRSHGTSGIVNHVQADF